MTAVPLFSGVAAGETGEFNLTYPLNLEPVIVDSKISKGQLKIASGTIQLGTGPGVDRGGINWNGLLYRVMGTKLCSIGNDSAIIQIGDVGAGGRCAFDYSFDRLAINSGANLYYYTAESGLSQVTDTALGAVVDMLWIDGYFMTTDGTYVVVTELDDPTTIKPLKYGSAEEDPDAIVGLVKYRDEAYVVGRYTIQPFQNVGGFGFPFATDLRLTIPAGCVGTYAKTLFGDGFAFVGGGRNEGLNVYVVGTSAVAEAVGCRALCDALDAIADPSVIEVEQRVGRNERRLFVHLPTETWVFLLNASTEVGQPIWYRIATDSNGYRCRNAIDIYGRSIVGDTQSGTFGYLSDSNRDHYAIEPGWQFDCGMLYNQSVGAIVHSVELVGLPGRGGTGAVFLSTTRDGETFSAEHSVVFTPANRSRRLAWRPHRRIGNYLGLRFRGTGSGLPGIAACEVKVAPLTS